MRENLQKSSIILMIILTFSVAYAASDVQLSQGTEIELVDVNNSSIFMGQDYNFTNVTVYGSDVEFTNNSVTNNLTVYPNNTQELNSTLKTYDLDNPAPGEVFKIETQANSPVKVSYEVDAKNVNSGSYELYDGSSNLLNTFASDVGTITWSETSWSNNTFVIKYTGNQVKLNWTDNSDNENEFRIYSNSTGSFPLSASKTVGEASGTGSTVKATHSNSINSGEYICYRVKAANQYGESSPATGCISIP